MKNIRLPFILFAVAVIFTHMACNDPSVIGSDLLSGDQLDIKATDTMTIRTYNVVEDSILTFIPGSPFNIESFPIGILADPIFGTASSGVYAELTVQSVLPAFGSPNFSNFILDSVILVLPYNAEASYGDLDENYSVEVYKLAENFPDTTLLYSNMDFMVDKLIGKIDYTPRVEDSVKVKIPGVMPDSLVNIAPQLRIPLTEGNFDEEFFMVDTQSFSSAAAFEEYFKGIYIKPSSVNNGMPSFNFRTLSAGIRVFYHQDTVYSEYLFPIFPLNVVTAKYEHDYSASALNLLDDYLGEEATYTDSLLFIQGMSGTNFVVEIPYAEYLVDKVINKAELVFPIQLLPEDNPLYYPASQVVISEILDDGSRQLIDDFLLARDREGLDGFEKLFGGDIEPDNTYRVNITTHLQDMSRGLVTEKLLISLFLKSEQAARTVLGGPGNSLSPAKLEITYTNF